MSEARSWAEGKSLGDDDYRFLDASKDLDKRDIQTRLDAEAEAKQIVEKARDRALWVVRFVSIGATIMAISAIGIIYEVKSTSQNHLKQVKQELATSQSSLTEAKENLEKIKAEGRNIDSIRKENSLLKARLEDQFLQILEVDSTMNNLYKENLVLGILLEKTIEACLLEGNSSSNINCTSPLTLFHRPTARDSRKPGIKRSCGLTNKYTISQLNDIDESDIRSACSYVLFSSISQRIILQNGKFSGKHGFKHFSLVKIPLPLKCLRSFGMSFEL